MASLVVPGCLTLYETHAASEVQVINENPAHPPDGRGSSFTLPSLLKITPYLRAAGGTNH